MHVQLLIVCLCCISAGLVLTLCMPAPTLCLCGWRLHQAGSVCSSTSGLSLHHSFSRTEISAEFVVDHWSAVLHTAVKHTDLFNFVNCVSAHSMCWTWLLYCSKFVNKLSTGNAVYFNFFCSVLNVFDVNWWIKTDLYITVTLESEVHRCKLCGLCKFSVYFSVK